MQLSSLSLLAVCCKGEAVLVECHQCLGGGVGLEGGREGERERGRVGEREGGRKRGREEVV